MTVAEKKAKKEPVLLYGNLYRVPIASVSFAPEKGDGFSFFNPRLIDGGQKGFSKEEMDELREAIRTEGLENPLSLRRLEDSLQLISGERRLRCLLKLIKDDADCWQPSTGEWVKASILYEFVEARIGEYDDQTAWKLAISANERAIGIGESATISLVRQLRTAEYTDKQIMGITGKSITWLKDTDLLNTLDKATLDALAADQINRTVAIDLAKIEDINERLDLLDTARSVALGRLASVRKKLEKEVNASESKADMAKAKAVVADHRGDDKAAAEAKERAEELEVKADEKRKEKEKLENGQARVTSKDLQKAKSNKKKAEGNDGGEKVALTKAKIKKHWLDVCVQLIKDECMDENGDPHELDPEDAQLVKLLCVQIEKGEIDIIKILKYHQKQKDKRAEG
jgi:hypothetical protein